jgi:hypothetical protein
MLVPVCGLLFIYFYTSVPISVNFGIMIEDFFQEVLDP